MKYFIAVIVSILGITAVSAGTVEMFGQEKYGFQQPKYQKENETKQKRLQIKVLGENNNFPLSSQEQGSVFSAIFDELLANTPIGVTFFYNSKNYDELIRSFERGEKIDSANTYFSYYKDFPFSDKKFLYPAFFYNDVYIITTLQNKLSLNNKDELKNYKGVHAATDKMADFVMNDFTKLNISEVKDLSTAFEQLLTGKVDYIAANYYPSQIEAYKLGIHNYIAFSQEAVWKQPLFLRVNSQLLRSPLVVELQKLLNSSKYKKIKEKAFDNLLEIYKENTNGIVPPTYIRVEETEVESLPKNEEK